MTKDKISELNAMQFALASSIIAAGKEHCPMVICLPDGAVLDASPFMKDEQTKDQLSELLAEFAKVFDVVCLISEGWMVRLDDQKSAAADLIRAGVMPTQHPNRREVLTMAYTVRGLGNVIAYNPIITENGSRRLERGELQFGAELAGRFAA